MGLRSVLKGGGAGINLRRGCQGPWFGSKTRSLKWGGFCKGGNGLVVCGGCVDVMNVPTIYKFCRWPLELGMKPKIKYKYNINNLNLINFKDME